MPRILLCNVTWIHRCVTSTVYADTASVIGTLLSPIQWMWLREINSTCGDWNDVRHHLYEGPREFRYMDFCSLIVAPLIEYFTYSRVG